MILNLNQCSALAQALDAELGSFGDWRLTNLQSPQTAGAIWGKAL